MFPDLIRLLDTVSNPRPDMGTFVIQPIHNDIHTIIFLHPFNIGGSIFAEKLFQATRDLYLQGYCYLS